MAVESKTQITFSQAFSTYTICDATDKITIDLNKLDIANIRTLVNGLGNILVGLSATMHKFE